MSEQREQYVVSIHEPVDQRQHPIFRMFDRPIAFHRELVTITGSITAALMLSQAFYWSKRTKDKAGWFYKTQQEWHAETGMTRREQESARRRLRQFDWWQEELRKANGAPTVHYRIDAQKFSDFVSTNLTNEFAQNVQMDMRESANSRKCTNAPKPITETTTENTAERDAAAAVPVLDDVFKTWGANMPGIMTEIIRDGLVDLTNDYSVPEILKAISIACERNKRTLGYVRGILDRGVNLGQENGNGNYANITLVRMDE